MRESMLSVVSPAFNEARNLPAVYEKIRSLTEDRTWIGSGSSSMTTRPTTRPK